MEQFVPDMHDPISLENIVRSTLDFIGIAVELAMGRHGKKKPTSLRLFENIGQIFTPQVVEKTDHHCTRRHFEKATGPLWAADYDAIRLLLRMSRTRLLLGP
ncbi:hypothetical protein E7V67_014950 [[Empedobacter] haloabium]|uniref:Uncharacterized protein n=1 Tax=[Empedobacter] haloabium TaxID=592317 RepID=A0ABZ1UE00_9BURK